MISVVIRTYNSSKTVCKAVDSALNQTLDKNLYEIIVVDDQSSDNTVDSLKNKYGDKIKVMQQKHLGPAETTNNGIKQSSGKYVTMLDSDDFLETTALEKMLGIFNKDKSADFVYCDYFEITDVGKKKISPKKNIFKTIGCGIMFKRELFDKFGFYDKSLIFSEYDFLIKLINNGKKGKHISIPLYNYVRSKNSLTADNSRVLKGMAQLEKKYGKDIIKKIRKY